MFDISAEDNPAFDAIFDAAHYDKIQYPAGADDASVVIDNLDLSRLIPSDIGTAGYYAYEGSLTTPPCTNIVRWHVMNARAKISEGQMEKFRELLQADGVHSQAPNFREPQTNVNTVYGCMDAKEIKDDRSPTAVAIVWVLFVI